MDLNFQKVVVIVATVALIIMLSVIGYFLDSYTKDIKFPPVDSDCPDYWVVKNKKCSNPKHLGTCGNSKDFTSSIYSGHNGDCLKARWASRCGLSWQGYTNDPHVCDDNDGTSIVNTDNSSVNNNNNDDGINLFGL